jgi:hypothetical protein
MYSGWDRWNNESDFLRSRNIAVNRVIDTVRKGAMCQLLGWFGLGDFGRTFGVRVHENKKLLVV